MQGNQLLHPHQRTAASDESGFQQYQYPPPLSYDSRPHPIGLPLPSTVDDFKPDASAPPDYSLVSQVPDRLSQLPQPPNCQYFSQPSHGYVQPVQAQMNLHSYHLQTHQVVLGVVGQPAIINQQAAVSPPSYLQWSIFNSLFCFWPLGLAAIIYSVKVGSARSPQEARSYSLTARNLNISATVLLPILTAIIVGSILGTSARVVVSAGYYPSAYSYYYNQITSYSYLTSYSYSVYYSTYDFYTAYGYQYATGYQYTQGFYYYG